MARLYYQTARGQRGPIQSGCLLGTAQTRRRRLRLRWLEMGCEG
jgi:hypothetical protein